jgi:hypothetical protein
MFGATPRVCELLRGAARQRQKEFGKVDGDVKRDVMPAAVARAHAADTIVDSDGSLDTVVERE